MYFSSVTSVPLMKCLPQLENRKPDCRLQTQQLFDRLSLSGHSQGEFALGTIYVEPFNSCFRILAIVSPLAGRGANESL